MRNLVFNALEKPLANGIILAPNGVSAGVGFVLRGVLVEEDVVSRILVGVAELGGVIVSYVGAESVLDESNIGNIVTHKEYRGKGIATELFEALLTELKAQGIKKLFLEVEHDNTPAIGLYEKLGFSNYGYRRDYYGQGKDAVLMSKEL